MKYLLLALFAPAVAFAAASPSAAASQAWVSNYVAAAIAASASEITANATSTVSNNCTVASIGGGTLVIEHSTDAALRVVYTESVITNGTLFVWNGAGRYINPAGTVQSTSSNLVYSGVSSFETNGVIRFSGVFDCEPILIQPSVSLSITNGMEVAQ